MRHAASNNGNVLRQPTTRSGTSWTEDFNYDGLSQTFFSASRAFTYDGENRQITATINGGTSTYSYDGPNPINARRVKAVTAGANAGTTIYVYDAAGQLAAEYGPDADTGTQFVTADHLGSTRLITDSTGAPVRVQRAT